jgi:hypothetical protein
MSGCHTLEHKASAGGAGGEMRVRAGEAHQSEARAGRGEAALAAGSRWAGHDEAIQTCAGISAGVAVGVRQALMAAEQEERSNGIVPYRSCACRR